MKWDKSRGKPEPIRALNLIREVECGEPLVDMRVFAPSTLAMRAGTLPWCRKSVALMMERAAQSLPPGIRLGYTEAWRPFVRQQMIYAWMGECLDAVRPGLNHAVRRRTLCRWVAPTDQKAPPGHCTGAAVDVYLLDHESQPLDVVSPFTRFTASRTYSLGLSELADRNRRLLVDSLLAVGFSNCREEYWHYSYGDAGWAVRTGEKQCHYGLIELDPVHWAEQQRQWEVELRGKPNPFLS